VRLLSAENLLKAKYMRKSSRIPRAGAVHHPKRRPEQR
jgi:hypothetical protein